MGKVASKRVGGRKIDWDAALMEWTGTTLSGRKIAQRHGMSEAGLRSHAKRYEWPDRPSAQDLVNAKAQVKIAQKYASAQNNAQRAHAETSGDDEENLSVEDAIEYSADQKAELVSALHLFLQKNLDTVRNFRQIVDGTITDWLAVRTLLLDLPETTADAEEQLKLIGAKIKTLVSPSALAQMVKALSSSTAETVAAIRKNLGYDSDTPGAGEKPAMFFDYGTGSYDAELEKRKAIEEAQDDSVQSGTDAERDAQST